MARKNTSSNATALKGKRLKLSAGMDVGREQDRNTTLRKPTNGANKADQSVEGETTHVLTTEAGDTGSSLYR